MRSAPDRGVVSAMLTGSDGESDLEEMGASVRLLISGGYNEPRDMVAALAWLLLAHPTDPAVALASAEGLERAIDEAVPWLRRWAPPCARSCATPIPGLPGGGTKADVSG
ncbi:hypothetical protein ACU61A_40805 [Pseudonocardia sichuanensis]